MSRVENHPCSGIQGGITLISGRSIAGANKDSPTGVQPKSDSVRMILPVRFATAGEEKNPILRQLTFSFLNFVDGLLALRPLMQ